ncbi:hypothetical protein ACFXGA_24220 [Actinosynnema sp. NPDC059335]|uniref:hypothetical protein n=1 Tax=Actinosynnema sp. NPDC059335 TaxID=3346804 RepID=UPI00366E9ED4
MFAGAVHRVVRVCGRCRTGNLAASASHASPWESVAAINHGIGPPSSDDADPVGLPGVRVFG